MQHTDPVFDKLRLAEQKTHQARKEERRWYNCLHNKVAFKSDAAAAEILREHEGDVYGAQREMLTLMSDWKAFANEMEEMADQESDSLMDAGIDIKPFFLHRQCVIDPSATLAATRDLDESRPVKRRKGDVESIVAMGASGCISHVDPTSLSFLEEVDVLDPSAEPAECDVPSDVLNICDPSGQCSSVARSGAELCDGWRIVPELASCMKPHQLSAAFYMLERLDRGVVLAHTMGLGKTLTTIAAVHTFATACPDSSCVLVLCPKTAMASWKRECAKWLPKTSRRSRSAFSAFPALCSANTASMNESLMELWRRDGGLLLCGYELFQRLVAKRPEAMQPDVLIMDEAHRLKNPSTLVAKAITGLTTTRRIALTGTPLQNNLLEYWYMLEHVRPGWLSEGEGLFRSTFLLPIEAGQFHDSTEEQVNTMNIWLGVLRKRLEDVVHRRDSTLLKASLPPKHEYTIFYAGNFGTTAAAENAFAQFQHSIDASRPQLLSVVCPMLEALVSDPQRHNVIVFSQSLETLRDLRVRFERATCLETSYLDGQLSDEDREEQIEQFQNGETRVFFCSTKAGGMGITLTEADRVLILDPCWNPTFDLQAVGRAWRMGQQREVKVYRFIADGTMQKGAYQFQTIKWALACRLNDDSQSERIFTAGEMADYINAPLPSVVAETFVDRFAEMAMRKRLSLHVTSYDANFAHEASTMTEVESFDAENSYNGLLHKEPRKLVHVQTRQWVEGAAGDLFYPGTDVLVPPYKPMIIPIRAGQFSGMPKLKSTPVSTSFELAWGQRGAEQEWLGSTVVESGSGKVIKGGLPAGTYVFRTRNLHATSEPSAWSEPSAPFIVKSASQLSEAVHIDLT
mgnify:CR=1 FL=1